MMGQRSRLWIVQLIKKAFLGRFLAARATRVPLLGRILERWLFEGDVLTYLPPDRVILVNQPVSRPQEVVLPSQVVEHFIERAGHLWIMDRCICRDATHCQDYPIDLGCLFLGKAAMGIHPQLGRSVTKQEALAHVQRCREVGLIHLIGRNKLDTIWLGVGPGRELLTICNCCSCCCLWQVLPHIAPQINAKVMPMPGVTVTVSERCVGCGTCTQGICFAGAIHMLDGRAVIDDTCKGCGRCVAVCPQQAIEIAIAHSEFVDRTIARIAPLVDVT